jgi:hypothetical protein
MTVDSEVHLGKPCAAGTTITVQSVLELKVTTDGLGAVTVARQADRTHRE